MPSIGSIAVNLIARTRKFQQSMQKATAGIRKFAERVRKLTKIMATFAVAGIGAVVGGLTALAKKALDFAKHVDRLRKATGLSAEMIQKWDFFIKKAGGSTDDVVDSLQDFTERMGEAAIGEGEALEVLERWGMANDRFFKAHPDEQFRQVADQLFRVATAAEKAEAANKLFGGSAMRFLQLFGESPEVLKKWAEAYEKSVLTEDQLAAMNKFNSMWAAFSGNIQMVARQIGVQLIPPLLEFGQWVRDEGIPLIRDQWIPMIMDKWVPAIREMVKWVVELTNKLTTLLGPLTRAATLGSKLFGQIPAQGEFAVSAIPGGRLMQQMLDALDTIADNTEGVENTHLVAP